ncbi:hypothetical protein [Polynucleobacter necessarius]|uniref:hypothetical protein n=1 Tax=Polynucleobacter necessarius TaxID=576610 RepID=UPI000E099C97|nr:hypothetical protein [Polynucleobacter necessarius]HAT38878.1 hypothetical protein [Polynucleobacter sp.]
MSHLQIISTPDSLNGALETWFVQNEIFGGAPYSLGINPAHLGDSPVVYLALYQINRDLISHIKPCGSKVVLYHMGGECLDKALSAYSECDLVIRNYCFSSIINSNNLGGKIIWAPNSFRTGVGPRVRETIKKASHRQ